MLPYRTDLKLRARQLRNEMTDAERRLWWRLRGKQVLGVPFYRQKPIGDFIVDFYAPAVKLVVEVDGGQHFEEAAERYDAERSAYLGAQGLRVLRFSNVEVLSATDAVVDEIAFAVESRRKSP